MRYESAIISVSWIPSEAVPGMMRLLSWILSISRVWNLSLILLIRSAILRPPVQVAPALQQVGRPCGAATTFAR